MRQKSSAADQYFNVQRQEPAAVQRKYRLQQNVESVSSYSRIPSPSSDSGVLDNRNSSDSFMELLLTFFLHPLRLTFYQRIIIVRFYYSFEFSTTCARLSVKFISPFGVNAKRGRGFSNYVWFSLVADSDKLRRWKKKKKTIRHLLSANVLISSVLRVLCSRIKT